MALALLRVPPVPLLDQELLPGRRRVDGGSEAGNVGRLVRPGGQVAGELQHRRG